ncbi:hypothetical protein UK23_34940 [Lentzea aerocolonigenes]|uniref:Uncharacterized protein n=1 Tax=Lentzea aerocolonigenes TaxID=68170 RepID=A0A0F0GK82_LENAE|nr:hypothetical protein [Lentzea aerocolonigenes]KJK42976.1 hypothetical protein UK23_34940 [Lentzea aerocolonigenes]
MFSYSGPARLVYADGRTVDLDRADLIETVTGGLWQWSGAGTSTEPLIDGDALMRLPTGTEAGIVVSNVRVITGAHGVACSATLFGSYTD